ncbi:uncharacterized protein LOC127250368 [Andrographis paniculata]|uniref:uncharacterized protein LOC127250368 n=1 Tax=Andrographis paniculata TaxID=175694 RepID=UPI0021E6FE43|nr:uncharacterized protein LOC127250368 [Andrographis paniculata]
MSSQSARGFKKRREGATSSKPPLPPPTAVRRRAVTVNKTATTTTPSEGSQSNRLLAGCMAHEYLTNGTLFGQKLDPARAEAAVAVNSGESQISEAEPTARGYAEVALLLRSEGVRIPGVVNPTQLAKWIECGRITTRGAK